VCEADGSTGAIPALSGHAKDLRNLTEMGSSLYMAIICVSESTIFSGLTALEWTALEWTALEWTALEWTALEWTALEWTALSG
jgi:hypothetical protein